MLRAGVFTLLVTSLVAVPLSGQSAGGAFAAHPGAAVGHSYFAGERTPAEFFSHPRSPSSFFPRAPARSRFRLRHHHEFAGFATPYFLSDYGPFADEENYADAITDSRPAPVAVERHDEVQSRAPAAAKQQLIEIHAPADSKPARMLPPTIFILTDGERLESRRFMLTASTLSVTIDRRERIMSLDLLDMSATFAANRERGVAFRVPNDRNEIFLSF